MQSRLPDDRTVDELLRLAGVSVADPAARRWMGEALAAAQFTAEGKPRPSPAEHNAPLDTIERTTDRLIAALGEVEASPARARKFLGPPLGVRNRNHRDRGKCREDHLMLRQVESAMERGDEWCRLTGE